MLINIQEELENIKLLYKEINEEFNYNKSNISKEIKKFEEKHSIELPDLLNKFYNITNGTEEIIGGFKFDSILIGVKFCTFQKGSNYFNGPIAEYDYLKNLNDSSWNKCPQVNKEFKTNYKFNFAIDNINLGGYFCIDYRPSILGKVGQVLFITRWGINFVSENFESFFQKSILELKNNFGELKSSNIYAINIKKAIEQDNEVLFKRLFDPEYGIEFYIKSEGNLMCYAHKCNCNNIIRFILNDLKYPIENYLIDAVSMENEKICIELLSKNIDANKMTDIGKNRNLLIEIVTTNNNLALMVAEVLIKKGANVNYINLLGCSILDSLYHLGIDGKIKDKMIALLIGYGAKIYDPYYKEKYLSNRENI